MEAPKLPSLFKQNRSKTFDFKPRYYDERKERLESLRRKYSGEQNGEDHYKKAQLRDRMTSEWRSAKPVKQGSSNVMLLVIIGILTLLAYLIFYY